MGKFQFNTDIKLKICNNKPFREAMKHLSQGYCGDQTRFANIEQDIMMHSSHTKYMKLICHPLESMKIEQYVRHCKCDQCAPKPKNTRAVIHPDCESFWCCVCCQPSKESLSNIDENPLWIISNECSFNGPTNQQLLQNLFANNWGREFLENIGYEIEISCNWVK